jgi:dihydrofolate synthase / folylpolyglutamate synthase
MNYQEALAYIYSLSDYERGAPYTRNREENLARELRLLELLGNPQDCYTCTLIAGTKGKGSTAAFIERVLRQAGLRTGLYTQPDLHTFRERMRVNGLLISEDEVAALLPEVRATAEGMRERHEFGPLNTYQVATALTFLYFCRQHIQHAVLEVGLGGRLDATNVTHPLVSVITSISYDHMEVLGDTLTKIATEKAGIIKPNGIVVTSAQSPEALLAIAAVCQRQHARLVRIGAAGAKDPAQSEVEAGILPALSYRYRMEKRSQQNQHFTVETPERLYTGLEITLAGQHQLENATAALATLEMLRQQGIAWDEQVLREGLGNTRWPARIDVVGQNPTIIVDGAHNADSMEKLIQALRASFTMHRLIVVLSLMRDKDLAGVARALAGVDVVVLTRVQNPRAATIEQMQAAFAEYAPHVELHTADNSNLALDKAVILSAAKDLICATGSLYLAGEALRWAAARGDKTAAATIESVDH